MEALIALGRRDHPRGATKGLFMVPLKQNRVYRVEGLGIEYGFGHHTIRSPYTPYSIYLRGTIG